MLKNKLSDGLQDKVNTYLKLGKNDTEKAFLIIRKDFLEYKLSLDDFARICDYLWFNLPSNKKAEKLGNMLLNTAELFYYTRKANNRETANIVAVNLKNALTYDAKNS